MSPSIEALGQIEPIVLFGLIAVAGVILLVVLFVGFYGFLKRERQGVTNAANKLAAELGLTVDPQTLSL